MQEICSKLKSLLAASVLRSRVESVALSGGLDSSILASFCKGSRIKAFSMVAKDFPSTDLVFAQIVSKFYQLKLYVKDSTTDEILDEVEEAIKILKVFNPIEIRNNIVPYLTMKFAKENGMRSMMTGDGADELFGGYHFFKRLSYPDLQKDLQRIWTVMHFPSTIIARHIGIELHTPFLDKEVLEYAKSIPADLKIREEKGKKYGKWILRKAFEDVLPESITWREKEAMQDGSGTSGLTSFFDKIIPNSVFSEKSGKYHDTEKVMLESKEALHYYGIYRRYYDPPENLANSDTRCPKCNYDIQKDSHFCRMCGSFPI